MSNSNCPVGAVSHPPPHSHSSVEWVKASFLSTDWTKQSKCQAVCVPSSSMCKFQSKIIQLTDTAWRHKTHSKM